MTPENRPRRHTGDDMTPIDPTALLTLHDDYDDDGHCDECGERRPCTVRALVAALAEHVGVVSGIDAYVLALRLANARALDAEAEVARLRARVAAVEALHYRSRWESSVPPGSVCACGQSPYPCATVRALAEHTGEASPDTWQTLGSDR